MEHKTLSHEEISIWEAFVEFINKSNTDKVAQTSTRKIDIQYNYLDVKYNHLIFKYLIKDGAIIGIEFFVPEHPKSTLSHRLINRVGLVSSAIKYVTELSQNKN